MTPVLLGRIQTRLFVSLVVGGLWTVLVTPFLLVDAPGGAGYRPAFLLGPIAGRSGLRATYALALATLVLTTVVGCVLWEPLYHGLMALRWEKDWPALFGLLQVVPEGLTAFLLLHIGALNPLPDVDGAPFVPGIAFACLFTSTWIVTWLVANGPLKIFFIRWRFQGGRLV